jgi:hypothetical protein
VILSFSDVSDCEEGLRWSVEMRNWDVLSYEKTEELLIPREYNANKNVETLYYGS